MLGCASVRHQAFDVLFVGASVVDGSGAARRQVDVGIRDGFIVAMGVLSERRAHRLVEVRGLVLAPGFIDIHSHAGEGLATAGLSAALPLVVQGVTTVVINPDGGGPIDMEAQSAALRRHGLGVNVAQLVAHGSIRQEVLGMEAVAPSEAELEAMRGLVRRAMAAGAWGLSSGTFYAPGSYSEPGEIVALARVVADFGGIYTSHIRDESNYTIGVVAAVEEVIDVARQAHLPVVVTHVKALGPFVWGLSEEIIERIETARDQGLRVFADQYPYAASATQLGAALLPRWAQAGGRVALAERLADPDTARSIRVAMAENLERRGGADRIQFRRVLAAPELEGRLLSEVALVAGSDPLDFALELLASGDAGIVSFNMDEDDVRRFMARDWVMTSSDGDLVPWMEGVPHPRAYAAFARKLETYVMEEQVLTLEQAVRSMTRLPADVMGLADRGRIEIGAAADLVIFDPASVRANATFTEPHQLSTGMEYVLVNGVFAVDQGRPTSAVGGVVLSKASP